MGYERQGQVRARTGVWRGVPHQATRTVHPAIPGTAVGSAAATYQDIFKAPPDATPKTDQLSDDELHMLRQDTCGVHRTEALRTKRPEPHMRQAGATQLWLAHKGAPLNGPYFVLGGKQVRVIDGAGQTLNQLKRKHLTGVAESADMVICAGAFDDGRGPLRTS